MRVIRVEFNAEISDSVKDMDLILAIIKSVNIVSNNRLTNVSSVKIVDANDVTINIDRKSFNELLADVSGIRDNFKCL